MHLGGGLIHWSISMASLASWLSGAMRWNELGIAGLVGSALALAVLMIPRVLDLALVDAHVEA